MGQHATDTSSGVLLYLVGAATLFGFYLLVRPAINRRRWSSALDLGQEALLMTVLSAGFLMLLLPPYMVPVALIAIGVHEYGHVLAYRLTGHRNPKFQFVPFGGVAYSQQHHQSNRDAFFVAIMGPGFSIALLVILLVASKLAEGVWLGSGANSISLQYLLLQVALWVGFLNAINLLPIYPLDGGKALQSIASVAGPRRMRSIMMTATMVTSLAIGLIAITMKMWILLFVVMVGLMQADLSMRHAAALPAMRRGDAILCALVYLSTIVALGYLARHAIYSYGVGAFQILAQRFGGA